MIGKKSADCDENDKLNKLNEKDCVENSSGKLKQDCVDDSNKECLDNNDKLDKEENSEKISCGIDNKLDDEPNNSQYSNNENDEDRIRSKKTYASAIKNSGWFETNKLFVVPTVVTELGDEVVVFDEELVELGSKKWELTLVGQLIGHTMSLPALNYHLRRMWSKFGYKEIIDNGNGKWLFKFSNEIGMVTVANQSPWMVNSKPLMKWDSASKGFKETIELQYRDKKMNVKGSKTVKVTNDWKPPICSHCIVFRHDHKNCKLRAKTEEEIAAKKLNVDKQVGKQKENEFMQYKGRKHAGNIRTNKPGQTNYYRNNFMSGEGYRRFTGPNKQQWNKKVSNNEGNIDNKNKNQCVEEERLVKINKSQNVTSSTKDPQTSNSFSVFRDLEGDNIQGLNMLKDKSIVDKRSWEADREKERNERLDEMEGFVEDIEDLYDEDRIVAKNLVADELKSTSSSLVFGHGIGVSNMDQCNGGCRITVGWNSDEVKLLVVHSTRRTLWNELQLAKCITNGIPWIIMGDFNVTLKLEEHSASSSVISCDMQDFIDCVNMIEVEDVCMTGMYFTWIKSPSNPSTSILKKLDRIMANEDFFNKYNQAFAVFHPFMISDHSPVVLTISKNISKKKKSFKFANFVADKKGVPGRVSILEEFHEALDDEEKFLSQKTKVDWLGEGDRNSAYFHKVVKRRRNKNRVLSINNAVGDYVEGSKIAEEFTLSKEEAYAMISDVIDHEINSDMFSIDECKAPGPDGYIACFYKKAWSVIGNDLYLAIKEFFKSGRMLKEINSNLIALIPKVQHLKLVTEFRPIVCCNVLYKCISKILTNRIKESLNKLVNLNQSAFIQGRNIQDNILLTQELLKGYNRKGGTKRCALKIDIAKAYDTVSWNFLRNTLIKFGFHKRMVDWIYACISSTTFSIYVNGESNGYFQGGRGLRQGDL
ncbi:RNA-directed DNA polymerase, eukaryota, reverse transcriptase zinc-binding domain protein [Tanacetum coccineum]